MKRNGYYIRNRKPKNRQNDWAIAVVIDAAQWPLRSIRHRGCDDESYFGQREMTQDEVEEWQGAYRLAMYRYYDWQTFINDEMKYIPEDHPLIQKILEAKESGRFHLIPKKPQTQLALPINQEEE